MRSAKLTAKSVPAPDDFFFLLRALSRFRREAVVIASRRQAVLAMGCKWMNCLGRTRASWPHLGCQFTDHLDIRDAPNPYLQPGARQGIVPELR